MGWKVSICRGRRLPVRAVLKSRWKKRRMFLPGPGADARARSLWRRFRKLTALRLPPGTEAAVKPVRRRVAKAVAPENGDSAGPEAEIAVHAAPARAGFRFFRFCSGAARRRQAKVIRQRFVRKPREQEPEADASVPSIKVVQEGAADFSEDAAREPRRTNEPQRQRFDRQNRRNNNDRFNKNRNNRQDGRNGRNGNDRVKNRWNNNQEGGTPQNSAPVNWRRRNRWTGCWKLRIRGSAF